MQLKRIIFTVISAAVAIGAACAGAYVMWKGDWGIWCLAYYALMFLCFPLASALHECGHALVGVCAGFKVKPAFRFFGSSFCKLSAVKGNALKARFLSVAFGGLAVNALFCILCSLALWAGGGWAWCGALLPSSAYLLVLNALPFCTGGGKTDGEVITETLRGEDSAKVLLAILSVQAELNGGKPLAQIEESKLTDLPQLPEDDINFITLTKLRAEYYAANGNSEKAEFYKSRFEELKIYLPDRYEI